MMEIYRTRIDTIRNYNLDPNEVIKGLNGYYESDKRNGYIIVKRNDFEGPAYFTAALYLSALIEWLREDHDIFYYPGMDIRDSGESGLTLDQVEAAKMCCLRESIKAALRKRGISCKGDADIPELVDTLFEAYDGCDRWRRTANLEKSRLTIANADLKKEIEELLAIGSKQKDHSFSILQDLYRDIFKRQPDGLSAKDIATKILDKAKKEAKQECYKYLWDALKNLSPDCDALKIDRYEDLVDRIFYEMSLVNDGCKRCWREHSNEKLSYIRRTNKAEEEVKNLRGQITRLKGLINAMNEEVKDM